MPALIKLFSQMNVSKLWSKAAGSEVLNEPTSSGKRGSHRQGQNKHKKGTTTRREMLALRPVRNPQLEWSEEDDHVVLMIQRASNWKTRLLNIFFPLPEARRIELDAMGTDVWRMIDGQSTIDQIAKSLAGKYKLTTREAELSLQQFFKELGRRGYIGFWVEQPPAANAETSTKKSRHKQ